MFENIKNIAPAILYRDQIHTEFTNWWRLFCIT